MTVRRVEEVVDFYQSHPISERQIMSRLKADGADLSSLTEDTLQQHDQDHFGGIDANAVLAEWAGVARDSHVLDPCCGLGGPARYLADTFGCRVTGVDITQSRVEGATNLTRMTGLDHLVSFQVGNALELPFGDGSFDVAIGQEAFCHIPEKPRLIAECSRVLRRGGRFAFTDIVQTDTATPATRDRLEREMTFRELATAREYQNMLGAADFEVTRIEDLGRTWRGILQDRLAMYRSLEDQTVARFGRAHFEKWDGAYAFFVGRYGTGELSGVRILAVRR